MQPNTSDASAAWRNVDARPEPKISYLELLTAQLGAIKRDASVKLALQPGQSVLEVGCGMGHDTQYLATLVGPGGRAVGVDFSAELIAKAQARTASLGLPLTYQQGDAQALPFADNSFDAARMERTLQHLPDPGRAVAELARVVRPGGRIVVFEPDWDTVIVSGGDIGVQRAVRTHKTDKVSAHGAIGRDVPSLLLRAGCTLNSVDGGFFSMLSLELADTTLALRANLEGAIAAASVTAEAGAAWWAALEQRDREGGFYAMIAGTIVLATVG
jgi:SAM-dependent methyltransferase